MKLKKSLKNSDKFRVFLKFFSGKSLTGIKGRDFYETTLC